MLILFLSSHVPSQSLHHHLDNMPLMRLQTSSTQTRTLPSSTSLRWVSLTTFQLARLISRVGFFHCQGFISADLSHVALVKVIEAGTRFEGVSGAPKDDTFQRLVAVRDTSLFFQLCRTAILNYPPFPLATSSARLDTRDHFVRDLYSDSF